MNIIDAIKQGKRFKLINKNIDFIDPSRNTTWCFDQMNLKEFIELEVEIEEEKIELTRSQVKMAFLKYPCTANSFLKELGFTVED
jgi:hypothetical protein